MWMFLAHQKFQGLVKYYIRFQENIPELYLKLIRVVGHKVVLDRRTVLGDINFGQNLKKSSLFSDDDLEKNCPVAI